MPFDKGEKESTSLNQRHSVKWVEKILIDVVKSRRDYLDAFTQLLPLNVGSIDITFNVTNRFAKHSNEKMFEGVLNLMNEFGQAVGQYFLPSLDHGQIKAILEKKAETLQKLGKPAPKAIYADDCCQIYNTIVGIWPHLSEGLKPPPPHLMSKLPEAELPSDPQYTRFHGRATDYANSIAEYLADREGKGLQKVIGFDAEWSVYFGQFNKKLKEDKIGTIQIALPDGRTFVFHLLGMKGVPHALAQILRDPKVIKVGRQISGDCKRLGRDWGVQIPDNSFLDLGPMCRKRGLIPDARKGLAELSQIVLQKYLPKPSHVRLSTGWSNPDLSADQIKYAALDAWISLAIYEKVGSLPLVGATLKENSEAEIEVGTRVEIVSGTGRKRVVIAHGTIVKLGKEARDWKREGKAEEGVWHGHGLSKKRCLVTIERLTDVMALNAKLPFGFDGKSTLGDFKSMPATILVDFARLRPLGSNNKSEFVFEVSSVQANFEAHLQAPTKGRRSPRTPSCHVAPVLGVELEVR